MTLTSVNFENVIFPVEGNNLSAPSYLTKVNTTNNINYNTNVYMQGASPVYLEACNLNGGETGINVSQSSLYVRCSLIKNLSTAINVTDGGSLYMHAPYGKNDISGNVRTIVVNNANILNLYNGYNMLRSATNGAGAVVNGSMTCGPTTINALRNNWNVANTSPTFLDYNVARVCDPNTPLTISDGSPISTGIVACMESPPNESYAMGEGSWDLGLDVESGTNGENNELTAAYFQALNLLSYQENENLNTVVFVESTSDDDETIYISPTENESTLDQTLAGFNAMSAVITTEDASDLLGMEYYIQGFDLAFDAYSLLMNSSNSEINIDFVQITNTMQNLCSQVEDQFIEWGAHQNEYFIILDIAQVYRMSGDLSSAIAAVNSSFALASSDEMVNLSNKLLCLLTAELEAIEFEETNDFMDAIGACIGNSNESGLQAIAGSSPSADAEYSRLLILDAQPNPVENELTVTIESQSFLAERIEVYDMQGKKVKALSGTTTERIDMSGLPAGVYIVLIHFLGGELGKSKVYKL